jgi:malate synthase
MDVFERTLGDCPNQLERQRPEVAVTAADLLTVGAIGGQVTESGLRTNINVGIQYIESWLRGIGAAAINNLMEDAATAEISRSQVWQWTHHGVRLADGSTVTRELVRQMAQEERARIEERHTPGPGSSGRLREAAALFEQVALSDELVEFLTQPAYDLVP